MARNHESICAEAKSHFGWLIDTARSREQPTGEAKAALEMGMRLLQVILDCSPGSVLSVSTWLSEAGYEQTPENVRRALQLEPYLGSSLGLLAMEFVHADVGILPYDEVRCLIEDAERRPRTYKGAKLTTGNVVVQYRRLPLENPVMQHQNT